MSALFVYPTANRIDILADGAVYDFDGVVHAIGEKILVASRATMAVAWMGDHRIGTVMSRLAVTIADMTGSFDEAVERIAVAMSERREEFAGMDPCLLVLAGWSAETGLGCWVGLTKPIDADFDAGKLYRISGLFGGGISTPSGDALEAVGLVTDGPEDMLERCGADVLQLIRELPGRPYGHAEGRPLHAVGGHAQLVTITPESVRSKIQHRWPDRVGKRIVPFVSAEQLVA